VPTVAVYVPAARWRELLTRSARDPAEQVRDAVRVWLGEPVERSSGPFVGHAERDRRHSPTTQRREVRA